MIYRSYFKRAVDVGGAIAALVLVSPLLFIVALLVRIEDGGPVIFKQTRVGRYGQLFTLLKFRSMPVDVPSVPSAEARALQVTRVGGVIRRTNIDELPQLWNILRGDMSLIGPRPALPSQNFLIAERARRGVSALRPGLTGLAQVNSYDGMPETEKLNWDERYAVRVALFTDIAIVVRTLAYLTRRPPTY